jgi:hypothetical protein
MLISILLTSKGLLTGRNFQRLVVQKQSESETRSPALRGKLRDEVP